MTLARASRCQAGAAEQTNTSTPKKGQGAPWRSRQRGVMHDVGAAAGGKTLWTSTPAEHSTQEKPGRASHLVGVESSSRASMMERSMTCCARSCQDVERRTRDASVLGPQTAARDTGCACGPVARPAPQRKPVLESLFVRSHLSDRLHRYCISPAMASPSVEIRQRRERQPDSLDQHGRTRTRGAPLRTNVRLA